MVDLDCYYESQLSTTSCCEMAPNFQRLMVIMEQTILVLPLP